MSANKKTAKHKQRTTIVAITPTTKPTRNVYIPLTPSLGLLFFGNFILFFWVNIVSKKNAHKPQSDHNCNSEPNYHTNDKCAHTYSSFCVFGPTKKLNTRQPSIINTKTINTRPVNTESTIFFISLISPPVKDQS